MPNEFIARNGITSLGNVVVTGSLTTSGSLTTTGTITAQTLVVQTITSSISSITGSTNFGTLSSNTHTFTGSMSVSGSLTGVGATFSGTVTLNAFGNQLKIGSNGGTDSFIGQGSGQNSLFIGDYSTATKGLTINVSTGVSTFSNNIQMGSSSQVMGSGLLKLGIASGNAGAALQLLGWAGSYKNWQIETAYINSSFNITPSTTNGGSTFTTPAFTITSDSNIGIGTSSPNALTEIRVNTNDYGNNLILANSYPASSVATSISFSHNTQAADPDIIARISGYIDDRTSSNRNGSLRFYTGTGGGLGERMRITSAGDICAIRNVTGIAGSYINFSFGAAGFMGRTAYDSYFTGNVYYDSGGWKLKYASHYANVVNWYDGEYSFLRSTTAGATDSAVSLQANLFLDVNGNAIFRGSVTQNGNPSDINLKENLVKITSPLEKISQINGYNFDWKEGTPSNGLVISVAEGMQAPESPLSTVHDAGLIAQEVEEIMPELVRNNGYKSLNYNGIIALLVESVKELTARVQELENK
jgi:hypothetical protein